MNPILSAGLIIGATCGLWMFVMGFTGWYKDTQLYWLFFLVILFEIAGLIWGLRRTAAQGRDYRAQVVAGTLMSVVAGVIIIACSLIFTTVAFPDYFSEVEAVQREILLAQGRSAAEIEQTIEAGRATATPMANAMSGFIGTLVTGIVASAVIAIVVRARGTGAARA